MAREELKVNIIIKGDHIFLGVQTTDCDPKMTTLQGNLQAALEAHSLIYRGSQPAVGHVAP